MAGELKPNELILAQTSFDIEVPNKYFVTKILYEFLPGWSLVLAGLTSSSVKSGSRTDTGLGRSDTSTTPSRLLSFLVIGEVDGDVNAEGGSWFSSFKSWTRNNKVFRLKMLQMKEEELVGSQGHRNQQENLHVLSSEKMFFHHKLQIRHHFGHLQS